MKAVIITEQGPPVADHIEFRTDWPDCPPPGPGRVTIRTEASALNHMDIWVGLGIPGVELTYPRVSGCDACGIVEAVGDGVDEAWVGRRVIVNAAVAQPEREHPDDPPASSLAPAYELIGEHSNGMHCERFNAPASNVAAVGDVDPHHAAAFGLVTLTAWSMMTTKGNLRPGQSVLITGIGGGVATAALSIAKWMGCPTIVTSRHQWKLDEARELGADHGLLDTGNNDWSKDVRKLTGKRGVDLAVDSVGKPTHDKCLGALARGGAYVTPGCTAGPIAETNIARIFWNQLRVLGSTMGSNAEFREIAALFRAGHLVPVIDSVHSAAVAADAWRRLEAADQFGNVVLDWTV